MTPHPIDTMPTADLAEEALALLYCPEQGGWHTAVFFERRGRLRDHDPGARADALPRREPQRHDRIPLGRRSL
jgi:hypothetical protein